MEVLLSATIILLSRLVQLAVSHGSHSTHYTILPGVNQTEEDKYLNRCMAGISHKDYPGPEPNLHGQCEQWADRACCEASTTLKFHTSDTWYNFNWNHCEKELSPSCRNWMTQDLCFYECSPNVGPWLIEHRNTIRDERFVGVPLCRSECDLWFDACKADYTCKADWSSGWNWTTGTNKCPKDSQCRTFEDTFRTAENFCENLWGGSFEVVDSQDSCMFLFFNDVNPNYEVANKKAVELVNAGAQLKIKLQTSLCLISMILVKFFNIS